MFFSLNGIAQTDNRQLITVDSDSIEAKTDSTVKVVMHKADSLPFPEKVKLQFKPNPKKAVLMAVVPGLGQIYNRKYWKLPIVYGGLMGCFYAVTWNNRNYQDYSTAYKDIIEDAEAPNRPVEEYNKSWQDFIPAGADPEYYLKNTSFQTALKNRKDYYRRYRDICITSMVAVYFINIVDAYVDSSLAHFDISSDLTMDVAPAAIDTKQSRIPSLGLQCAFTF